MRDFLWASVLSLTTTVDWAQLRAFVGPEVLSAAENSVKESIKHDQFWSDFLLSVFIGLIAGFIPSAILAYRYYRARDFYITLAVVCLAGALVSALFGALMTSDLDWKTKHFDEAVNQTITSYICYKTINDENGTCSTNNLGLK